MFAGFGDVYTYYTVKVTEKEIKSIAVNTYPSEKQFIGEPINSQNMTVKVTYNDGTSAVMDYGFELSGSITAAGKNPVTCTYKNHTCTFELDGFERTHIEFSTVSGKINSQIGVKASLVPSETVYDGSILIQYDYKSLKLNGITPSADIPDGMLIDYNVTYGTGLAKISFTSDTGTDERLLLATLGFTVLKGAYDSAEISVNGKSAFYDEDGDPAVYTVKSGAVGIITDVGDANCDGCIDIRDMIHIKKSIANTEYKKSCDLNGDKAANTIDIALLKKYILGVLKSLAG